MASTSSIRAAVVVAAAAVWPLGADKLQEIKSKEPYVQALAKATSIALKEARGGLEGLEQTPEAILHLEAVNSTQRRKSVATPELRFGLENLSNRRLFPDGWGLFTDDRTPCADYVQEFYLTPNYNVSDSCSDASTGLRLDLCQRNKKKAP